MSSSSGVTLRRSTAMVWRTLRSMRTALILLLMLALASVVGSLVPQWPNSPERVVRYQLDHPLVGAFYGRAGLFDVVRVLVVRADHGAAVRLAGRVPVPADPRAGADAPPEAHAGARDRRVPAVRGAGGARGSRPRDRGLAQDPAPAVVPRGRDDDGRPALAAEKGALREVGSLLFHWAFLLIVIGVIYGKGTGFTGRAVVVEGKTWIDAQANYDGQLRTGRFFSGDFTGVGLRLRGFEDTYRQSGQPMDFVSHVDLLDPQGNVVRQADIRVNEPASIDGVQFFQYGFGWAPVVEIRQGGDLIASEPITFVQDTAPEGVPQLAMPWRGILKLPSLDPQMGMTFVLWPDSRAWLQLQTSGEPVAMTQSFQPIMFYKVYRGDLTDPSLTSLDTSVMRKAGEGVVGAGQTVDLRTGVALEGGTEPAGLTISFPELRQYSVLQVSRDRGVPLVLLAAILVLLGLLPALYTSRRKIWVRAEPNGNGTVLKVGGFALQRKPQFDEEFSKLVDAMARAAGGDSSVEEKERVSSA